MHYVLHSHAYEKKPENLFRFTAFQRDEEKNTIKKQILEKKRKIILIFTVFYDQFNDILHLDAGSSSSLKNFTYFSGSHSF